MADPLTIDGAFKLAQDHENLYRMPKLDPVLVQDRSPHVGYELERFRPVCGTWTSGVAATFYADEKSGARFQGQLTSTSDIFETYAFTNAAIHPSLLRLYPKGSYVRAVAGSAQVIVRIKDVKAKRSSVGIDLPKAAFFALFPGKAGEAHKVDLERVMPLDCTRPVQLDKVRGCVKPGAGHPMEQCYREDVYIQLRSSEAVPKSEVLAQRESQFRLDFWRFSHGLRNDQMDADTDARPSLLGMYAKTGALRIAQTAIVGPFPDRTAAENYLTKLCWPVENRLDPSIGPFCRSARISVEKWKWSASSIYFQKLVDGGRVAAAGKRVPRPRTAKAGIVVARRTVK